MDNLIKSSKTLKHQNSFENKEQYFKIIKKIVFSWNENTCFSGLLNRFIMEI